MGLLISALVLAIAGMILYMRCNTRKMWEAWALALTIAGCAVSMAVAIICPLSGYEEPKLVNTFDLTTIYNDSAYVFIDTEKNMYYVDDETVIVVDADKLESKSCKAKIVHGDFEQILTEEYLVEAKKTFWTFANIEYTEYVFYITTDVN